MKKIGLGAHESPVDKRTIKHEDMLSMASMTNLKGGYTYEPTDIEHQHGVGICTAISLTQNARKYIGRKFSADFQYLLQKKYVDGDWNEGSSIFSALKIAKNYGFLPVEEFTYITEADRNLSYSQYIQKLQDIPEDEIKRLIKLCSDYKLKGYAQIDVTSPYTLSKGILDSKSGILCRYVVGKEWYTATSGKTSWDPKDINPLRSPKITISGHAITGAKFDYVSNFDVELANTWGASWNREGLGNAMWDTYRPTEAWIPYYDLTEAQLKELKSKLQKEISIIQKLISLYQAIKNLIK